MKRPLTTITSLVFVALLGLGVIMVAPFFKDPRFEVVNQSQHVVHVSAYWRDQKRELGPITPSSIYEFSVNDEAAMKFSCRFPDGRVIDSEEVYFTGGTGVIATITEKGIELKYEHEK